ncbi:hypothetical protein BMF94_1983 [Rhodotorula taiwanensis]|uniref:Uncharacterized protein n=1 Tax=Rhodotorula taiwanensis TaxID=741276 RepID=A0A2S5BE19_9BASI|nr:hypothetical protein BMF94_1983 [Rhodotorula taiwanensis]
MDALQAIVPVLVSLYHPYERTLSLALPASTPLASLSSHLAPYCPPQQQYLSYANGRPLPRIASPSATVAGLDGAQKDQGGFVALRLAVRLPGGKGGFASQLRAQGGRMSSNKAQNTDSCRGLDGRRLSTMKEAQKLAQLLEAEPDRLAAEAQAKQKRLDDLNAEIARLERQAGVDTSAPVASTSTSSAEVSGSGASGSQGVRGGAGGQKRRLEDSKYVEESKEIVSGVKDAVRAAMLKKRKKNKAATTTSSEAATAAGPSPSEQPKATGSSGSEGEKENSATAASAATTRSAATKGKGKGKAVAVGEAEPVAEV